MAKSAFVDPERVPDDAPVFVISVAAELAGMHPQTLRQYDRLGLVNPGRTSGGGRRYSARDVLRLRLVQRLSQEEGINLAGVKRIIELQNEVADLRDQVARLTAALDEALDRVAQAESAIPPSYRRLPMPVGANALVVWRPGTRARG
jgi:MerR family transcriptional regulator/heat shock protein HspR